MTYLKKYIYILFVYLDILTSNEYSLLQVNLTIMLDVSDALTANQFNYWHIDSEYAFIINSFFKDIKEAPDTDTLKEISDTFCTEGMKLKEFTSKARLMNDYMDIVVSADKLTEDKLETFLISVIRSERKDIPNYESEPSRFKKLFNKILRK